VYTIADVSENIYSSVLNDTDIYNHKSIVVVGDNDSGKTTLLKELLKRVKMDENESFYFIDAPNRVVYGSDNRNQASEMRYEDFSPMDILKERSSVSFLSKEDVFPRSNKGSIVTYSELLGNVSKYEDLFNKYFECKIEKSTAFNKRSIINGSEMLSINGKNIDSLSSSRAAIIRLIMEIEYAKNCGCKMVIIDEFDNCLDPDNQIKLISQFRSYYPNMRFIFVIHDFALLVQLSDIDAVIYNPKTAALDINIIDCDDITAIGEVERIRAKYIGVRDEKERRLSNCISEYLKKGKLSDKNAEFIMKTNRNDLNIKNRILYDYILEHQQ